MFNRLSVDDNSVFVEVEVHEAIDFDRTIRCGDIYVEARKFGPEFMIEANDETIGPFAPF